MTPTPQQVLRARRERRAGRVRWWLNAATVVAVLIIGQLATFQVPHSTDSNASLVTLLAMAALAFGPAALVVWRLIDAAEWGEAKAERDRTEAALRELEESGR